jgi:SpoVK/Ycf46/Vps4 family AAA+-type ATPase
MLVENVRNIKKEGRDKAFSMLELKPRIKELLRNMVEQHSRNRTRLDDLVPGKGNGLIALLHGPPGVGKTLTAESVAILTGKPLYSISMSDLGMTPAIVEVNLQKVFDLAVHWQAVLLFDEADVFLESRSLQDLKRNGLVSVLLRILEYYNGILFLTTNRVRTFDEAFQSRVHLAIKYDDLQEKERIHIWHMWLDQLDEDVAEVADIKEMVADELAPVPFNGRQIRNIIISAQALSQSRPFQKMTFGDIKKVMKVTTEFQQYLAQSKEVARIQNLR